MHIREYLGREARRITDAAPQGLTTAEEWQRNRPARVAQFLEMMGLYDVPITGPRSPLNVTVTGSFEREGYRVENLHFQSVPRLYVAGNLYIPTGPGPARRPAVLYLCGHAGDQKVHYQAHARRFAELGFVCLILDTIQYGEVFGRHGGTFSDGQWQWYSTGYTSAGVELWNAMRGLDLLQARDDVDGSKLGVTGISGGGSLSYWLAAADERIGCMAAVCSTGTMAGHAIDRTIEGHCDCVLFQNTYRWDLLDASALVAPRPCLIASGDRDRLFTITAINEHHDRLAKVYEALGASENLSLVVTDGKHEYQEASRTRIFSWFLKHLADREVPPEEVGDLDQSKGEPAETLRVFVAGQPPDDISTTIEDSFVKIATLPVVANRMDIPRLRQKLVATLREQTFGAFPADPPPLDFEELYKWETPFRMGYRFSFESERDWRTPGGFSYGPEAHNPAPLVLMLGEDNSLWYPVEFLTGIPDNWHRANQEPRGTRESSWGADTAWYVRRIAALTGRTIASMRVWDTLRALEALRARPEVDGARITLAAQGEMAAVALYAALLDGNIRAVILKDPPATQNVCGAPDGTGPSIEMLNCLRFTDLPQVAGLLNPAELVFVGPRPPSYGWAEDVHARTGGRTWHVRSLEEWRPDLAD